MPADEDDDHELDHADGDENNDDNQELALGTEPQEQDLEPDVQRPSRARSNSDADSEPAKRPQRRRPPRRGTRAKKKNAEPSAGRRRRRRRKPDGDGFETPDGPRISRKERQLSRAQVWPISSIAMSIALQKVHARLACRARVLCRLVASLFVMKSLGTSGLSSLASIHVCPVSSLQPPMLL